MDVMDKKEALIEWEKILQKTKERMKREVALYMARMIDERHQLIERSKVVLDKVQTMYQTQATNYET